MGSDARLHPARSRASLNETKLKGQGVQNISSLRTCSSTNLLAFSLEIKPVKSGRTDADLPRRRSTAPSLPTLPLHPVRDYAAGNSFGGPIRVKGPGFSGPPEVAM